MAYHHPLAARLPPWTPDPSCLARPAEVATLFVQKSQSPVVMAFYGLGAGSVAFCMGPSGCGARHVGSPLRDGFSEPKHHHPLAARLAAISPTASPNVRPPLGASNGADGCTLRVRSGNR